MTELSEKARALIRTARDNDGPSAGDRERVRRALFGTIVTSSTLGTTTSAAAVTHAALGVHTGAAATLAKGGAAQIALWFLGGSLAGGAVVSTSLVLQDAPHEVPSLATSVAVPRTPPKPTLAAPAPETLLESPSSAPLQTPRASTARPSPRIAAPPAADTAESPAPPSVSARASELSAELRLLERGQQELASGAPAAALAAFDEHAARFPQGALRIERMAGRVFALCALARHEEARRAALEFLGAAPNSPLAPRITASCAVEP